MAKSKGASEEMQDLQSEPTPPAKMDLVGGLVFTTFLALIVGVVMAQLAMKKYFSLGLFAS
jgi:hypothetical protein